ncbi:hypothetical protein BC793_101322 [Actinoplanes xinjiangensis]|uniref:Uncharacterized protein n=1 Tax=Actinoplanes xinjiangensis TaxID=512350 RepID=A0A316FV57_9ACTN|nr:hypothetical protein BC793_101322 [Actinoplanes xinjiangensis]
MLIAAAGAVTLWIRAAVLLQPGFRVRSGAG